MPGVGHHLRDALLKLGVERFEALAAVLYQLLYLYVLFRLQVFEGQVFELAAHAAHAEAVRDGRVDVERLLGDAAALFSGQVFERAHVVQAVGQLDEHHADVIDDRQQHLAHVERLPLFVRRVVKL